MKLLIVVEKFLVCFIIASYMLHDDVTIKQIKDVSLRRNQCDRALELPLINLATEVLACSICNAEFFQNYVIFREVLVLHQSGSFQITHVVSSSNLFLKQHLTPQTEVV